MKQIIIEVPDNCELKQDGNIYTIVEKEKKLTYDDIAKELFEENEVEIKNGLYTFTCGKEAFTSKLIVNNFAFWLVMAFIVVQAVVMVVYFVTDFEGKCREYLEFLDNKVQVCVNEGDENANNGVISYLRRRSTLRATQRRRSKIHQPSPHPPKPPQLPLL